MNLRRCLREHIATRHRRTSFPAPLRPLADPACLSAAPRLATPGTLEPRTAVDGGEPRRAPLSPDPGAVPAPDGDDVPLAGPVAIGFSAAAAEPASGLPTAAYPA